MSLNKEKCDSKLGIQVNEYLTSLGLNTPMAKALHLTEEEKINRIRASMTDVLKTLGLDLSDDSLQDTPNRVAKMLVKELNWGLLPENFPKCTTIENKMHYNEMVVEKASVNSTCEHHLVYFGTLHNRDLGCWIAYIPRRKVIGLSKLSRIVDYFAARPQVQERLVEQVSAALQYILDTKDVAVLIRAQHFCVLTRGVKDPDSYTVTSKLTGQFLNDTEVRKEFLSIVNR